MIQMEEHDYWMIVRFDCSLSTLSNEELFDQTCPLLMQNKEIKNTLNWVLCCQDD